MSPRLNSDPTAYFGSRQAAVAAVLFFLGIGCLFVAIVLGTQFLADPNEISLKDWWLALIPTWGIFAVPLALLLRKRPTSSLLFGLSSGWLAVALVTVLAMRIAYGDVR